MKSRLGLLAFITLMLACNNSKKDENAENGFQYQKFSDKFKTLTVPYQLSDTALLNNKDTVQIRGKAFPAFIPDSLSGKLLGKGVRAKFVPLGKIEVTGGETYYVVNAVAGEKKVALLMVFDKKKNFGAVTPFLVPDENPATKQVSSIDKSYSISCNITYKQSDGLVAEGKEVYAYNNEARNFAHIMTDVLDDSNEELINPIDTFPKKQKWTGDYVKDKKNIVSIRDGRKKNSLLAFIHIENSNDQCTGELKGDLELSGTNIAVYRQGGDPCVLELTFSPNSVTLKEIDGCGSRRGINCSFNGKFQLKKITKEKTGSKTKK